MVIVVLLTCLPGPTEELLPVERVSGMAVAVTANPQPAEGTLLARLLLVGALLMIILVEEGQLVAVEHTPVVLVEATGTKEPSQKWTNTVCNVTWSSCI